MKHFHLLGSVFRSNALNVKTPAAPKFEEPLVNSGLLGHDPQVIFSELPEQQTVPRRSSYTTTTHHQNHRNPIITPVVSKRAKTSIEEEIPTPTPALSDAPIQAQQELPSPNVFYRKVLPPNAPPADRNFLQLNELLDRMIAKAQEDDLVGQHEAFEIVFMEVIRQYFIECSGQGRLLDKCRLFFSSLAKHIPMLRKRFEKELAQLDLKIKECNNEVDELTKQLIPTEDKRNHLTNIVRDLRTDYQLLTEHLDGLNRNLAHTSREIDELKIARDKIDSRISAKDLKLIKLNEELRALDEVSARCTADTVQVADQLRTLLNQISNGKSRQKAAIEGIQGLKSQLARTNAEIDNLQAAIDESNKYIQMDDAEVQVDLVIKSKRSSAVAEARKRREKELLMRNNPLGHLFQGGKNGNQINIPEGGITISTYEDFATLKQLILENSEFFQMSHQSIVNAEKGDFIPSNDNPDYVRLFASKIVSDVIDRSVRKVSTAERQTQTLSRPMQKHQDSEDFGLKSNAHLNFIKMIPVDYSQRDPKSLGWIIKNIRMIYDEKLQLDLKCLEDKQPLTPLDQFTIDLAKRNYNLEFLAYQFCWDLNNTGNEWRESSSEVDMFMNALYEKINVEQLCFMLKCRDFILKVGAVVSTKTEDQTEQIIDYYLSQDQIEPALRKWWKFRYQPSVLQHCMEYAVARPAVHLEATKRYIAMNDILSVCVQDFAVDTVNQMNELLQKSRIVPRLSQDKFIKFMKSLIPYISKQDCDRFYRATVSKSAQRVDIATDDFIIAFKNGSILNAHEESPEQDVKLEELLESIKDQWEKKKEMLMIILKYFEKLSNSQLDNLGMRALVTDAQRFQSMLVHSLSIKNATEACYNYFQLVFSLDVLYSVTDGFDIVSGETTLISLECCVKEYWLDSIFDRKPMSQKESE